MTTFNDSDFLWELNNENLTAKMILSYKYPAVNIPRSIIYQSQKYIITEIGEKAIGEYVKTVTFPIDCQIFSFSKESFHWSNVLELTIPASVKELKYGWNLNSRLSHVKIDPRNKYFKIIDKKMIVGKSDPYSENFDTLNSAISDIYHAQIPSYIKYIAPYCFANTKSLREITFSEDSELLSIDENSFNGSYLRNISLPSKLHHLADGWCNSMKKLAFFSVSKNNKKFASIDNKMIVAKSDSKSEDFDILVIISSKIEEFTVPSNIKYIAPFCFTNCKKLKTVIFPDDSELLSIGKNAFSNTKIETISLPKKLREMSDLFSDKVQNLNTVFLSPSNSNFAVIDNDLLVGKSDQNKEDFDVLLFANRNIKQATIPNSIEYIAPHCFEGCNYLQSIQIYKESKLKKIGDFAFYNSAISKIDIPVHVKNIGKSCFENCKYLEFVTFTKDSELVHIDDKAFSSSAILKIIIPSNVEYIGINCFYSCSKLTDVTLPADLKIECINCETFSYSSIASVYIPKNVKKICQNAFCYCFLLEKVIFAEDSQLVSIGERSFNYTAIQSITIPKHTKVIDKCVFDGCKKLRSVIFDEISQFELVNFDIFSTWYKPRIILPKNVQIINGDFKDDIILENLYNLPVYNEKKKAFEVLSDSQKNKIHVCQNSHHLVSVLLSSINNNLYAIHGNLVVKKSNPNSDQFDTLIGSLKEINHLIVPSYIKYIKERSFTNNFKLKSLTFPEDSQLLVIGKSAFESTNIDSLSIPAHVQVIEENAFYFCQNMKTLEIPQNSELQSIKLNSFSTSQIKELFIPQHLKGIHLSSAFSMDKVVDIKISSNNKNFAFIDDKMIVGKSSPNIDEFDTLIFAKRDIQSAIIPSYIKCIYPCCFCNCRSLTNVEFADGSQLVTIGKSSFMNSAIQSIKIPSSVKFIGSKAFLNCNDLEIVIFSEDSQLEEFSDYVFTNTKIEEMTIPMHVKRINTSCFPKTLKKIDFSENSELEYIGERAFEKTVIENIIIPSSVEQIGPRAFAECHQIQTFSFRKNAVLDSIDSQVFLTSIIQKLIIPANVKIIRSLSFSQCQIKSLEFEDNSNLFVIEPKSFVGAKIAIFNIPENVTFSHGFADSSLINKFCKSPKNNNCKVLNDGMLIVKSQPNQDDFNTLIYANSGDDKIIIPYYIQNIAKNCFTKNLMQIEFENNSKLVSIGQSAFQFSQIIKITLPKHVKVLKENSFQFCHRLEEFIIPEDSELEIIASALEDDKIEHLFIPSNFKKIEFGDNYMRYSIKSMSVSPKNNNFQCINNGILIGKSQVNIDVFDTLILVCTSIKELKIPTYIKYIKKSCCSYKNVHSTEFQNDSQLQTIGDYSFSNTPIKSMTIPSSCVNIGEHAFNYCKNLKKISFAPDSKLERIGKKSFSNTSLVSLCIPENVKLISLSAFMDTQSLHSIEFLSDTLIIVNEYNQIQIGLQLMAIPNATFVNYRYYVNYPKECFLFVKAGAKFILS